MRYNKNSHSVYSLHFHLILVIKYRRKVLDDNISGELKIIFEKIGQKYGVCIEEWNHDVDHIHVLFRGTTKADFCAFIDSYKSCSSRIIKEKYPKIKTKLWKSYFWSPSYCLITTGGASFEVIEKYIESQGE